MAKTFRLYWVRADKQGSFDMGAFDSLAAAEAAIPAAEAELIDQCGPESQKEEIRQGSWGIEEESDDDETEE